LVEKTTQEQFSVRADEQWNLLFGLVGFGCWRWWW